MINRRSLLVAGGVAALSTLTALPAFADTYDDIMKAKKLKVALDLAIPPSGMMDANMKPTGSDVETAQLLAKDWGVELEMVQTTGPTRIPNLLTNKADVIISTLSITPDRQKVIDFSRPYAAQLTVVGAPKASPIKDWPDVRGKSISVTRGTIQDSMLTPLAAERGFTVVRYDDDATLVTAAVSGQAQMVCTSSTIVRQMAERNQTLDFEPKITIASTDLAVGIRKGDTNLMNHVNEWVVANLRNGKLGAIYKKYHGVDIPASLIPKD
jgi:polar amino acid transport system substrate-binding protein